VRTHVTTNKPKSQHKTTQKLKKQLTHETSREGRVGTDLTINLDQTLHQDGLDLTTVESVLETVTDENDQRKTLTLLVGTGRRLRGISTCIKRISKVILLKCMYVYTRINVGFISVMK